MGYLDKSITIVENARGLRLIPDDMNNVDLINYVLYSELPEFSNSEQKNDIKLLGKWLFNWKDKLLKDELPDSGSGDLRDTNYPLKLNRIGVKE